MSGLEIQSYVRQRWLYLKLPKRSEGNLGERGATSEPDIGMLGDPTRYEESATGQTTLGVQSHGTKWSDFILTFRADPTSHTKKLKIWIFL